MSVLVLKAAGRGADAVQGTRLLDMVTLVFWGLGPLVCALVPVEMFQSCRAPPSTVGGILALIFAARKHRAGIN